MLQFISIIWLPLMIILLALAIGGIAWFFFVRSIEVPWEDRNKHK